MSKLKEKTLKQIRNSKICKAKLQIALNKSAPTIQRYLDENNIMLTTITALTVISQEINIDVSDLCEN